MKKGSGLLLLFAFCLVSCSKSVKEKDIPATVKATLTSLYPLAKNVEWSKENGKFEAEFEQNETETSILIDANGRLVETETEIAVAMLPKTILDYVSKNLIGQRIEEAAKIAGVDGRLTYEAEVSGVDYLFDANGNFLQTQTEDSDDKEDKD
jgi:hypothetical protein